MGQESKDGEVPVGTGVTPADANAADAVPHPITSLRVIGQARELVLSAEKRSHTLGRDLEPAVDLTLDDDGVSRVHAVIYRKGNKLRVVDQNSTNGTYRRGERDPDFEVGAGETFQVTRKLTLVALDDTLAELRKRLQWAIGLRAHADVDTALLIAAQHAPLLLVGATGCDQRLLAEEMHKRSPMRGGRFVTAPLRFINRDERPDASPEDRRGILTLGDSNEQTATLARASNGTLFLDLNIADSDLDSLPDDFITQLFGGDPFSIRPIIAAPSREHAAKLIGDSHVDRLGRIELPSLATRRDDIAKLLDALILHTFPGVSDPPRLAELGQENIAGLSAHTWPGNFDEMRNEATPLLRAALIHKSIRKTAAALGIKKSTLYDRLDRIGVHLKPSPEDADGETVDADALTNPNELPTPPDDSTDPSCDE